MEQKQELDQELEQDFEFELEANQVEESEPEPEPEPEPETEAKKKKSTMSTEEINHGLHIKLLKLTRTIKSLPLAEKTVIDSKTGETKQITPTMMLCGGHVAIVAIEETLVSYIMRLALLQCTQGTADLYELKLNDIKSVIKLDKNLNNTFGHYLHTYEKDVDYQSIYESRKNEVIEYLVNHSTGAALSNVNVLKDAARFICFILLKNRQLFLVHAQEILNLYHKTVLKTDLCVCIARLLYSNELLDEVLIKIDSISRLSKKFKAEVKAKAKKVETEVETEPEPEPEAEATKPSKKTKGKKHRKSKKPVEDADDEGEAEAETEVEVETD